MLVSGYQSKSYQTMQDPLTPLSRTFPHAFPHTSPTPSQENSYWHSMLVGGYQSKSYQKMQDLLKVYKANMEAREKVGGMNEREAGKGGEEGTVQRQKVGGSWA